MGPVRGIPTSRAYWELKAEQVMNRVYEPEHPIVIEICENPPKPVSLGSKPSRGRDSAPVDLHDIPQQEQPSKDLASIRAAEKASRKNYSTGNSWGNWAHKLRRQPTLLVACTSLSLVVLSAMTLLILDTWTRSQQAIRQERNLLLMERIRMLGPSSPAPTADPATATEPGKTEEAGLPPPPPGEPWMEELTSLPTSNTPAADVLRVPVNNRIGTPAPAASSSNADGDSTTPQLVGVVQVPGQSGYAIFQIGSSSTSAAVGENIGSSGWRLRSANGDSAVIEKGGEQRRMSINSGM